MLIRYSGPDTITRVNAVGSKLRADDGVKKQLRYLKVILNTDATGTPSFVPGLNVTP